MMVKSDCPRHFWLAYSLLSVGAAPCLAGRGNSPITLTFPTLEQRQMRDGF